MLLNVGINVKSLAQIVNTFTLCGKGSYIGISAVSPELLVLRCNAPSEGIIAQAKITNPEYIKFVIPGDVYFPLDAIKDMVTKIIATSKGDRKADNNSFIYLEASLAKDPSDINIKLRFGGLKFSFQANYAFQSNVKSSFNVIETDTLTFEEKVDVLLGNKDASNSYWETIFATSKPTLEEMMSCLIAIASEDYKQILQSFLWKMYPSGVLVASTDGHRMSRMMIPSERYIASAAKYGIIIPGSFIKAIKKTLKLIPEEKRQDYSCLINYDSVLVGLHLDCDGFNLSLYIPRAGDEKDYPDVNSFFKFFAEPVSQTTFKTEELLLAISRVKPVSELMNHIVTIKHPEDTLKDTLGLGVLSVVAGIGKTNYCDQATAQEQIECEETMSTPLSISINIVYLEQALKNLKSYGDKVEILVSKGSKAILLKSLNTIPASPQHLIVPISPTK